MTEQMKPSGIAWIKEIPQSWKLNKVALLLDNDEKKRELMQVFLEDVYKNLREG